ncbi:transporter [Vespertiliibacter pulmonis]|nr:transporter [Vespertiliibacter pulmonis]
MVEQPQIAQPHQAHNVEKTALPQNNTALNPNSLNINNASAAEIQDKLIGIGAKKAQAIVDYREKNGKFIALEQLTEVSGIGKATLEKNRDRIILE